MKRVFLTLAAILAALPALAATTQMEMQFTVMRPPIVVNATQGLTYWFEPITGQVDLGATLSTTASDSEANGVKIYTNPGCLTIQGEPNAVARVLLPSPRDIPTLDNGTTTLSLANSDFMAGYDAVLGSCPIVFTADQAFDVSNERLIDVPLDGNGIGYVAVQLSRTSAVFELNNLRASQLVNPIYIDAAVEYWAPLF